MNTEIKNAVSAADQDAQYDDKAKRLLGNKIILAHILVEPGLTNIEKEEAGQRVSVLIQKTRRLTKGL